MTRKHLSRQKRARKQIGFTIIEVLIVVVIIAILAAIVVVSYNGITKKAVEASMQSDLEAARNGIAIIKAGKKDYPTDATAANNGRGLVASGKNEISYSSGGSIYTVAVTNPATNKTICLKTGQIRECVGNWTLIDAGEGTTCGLGDGRVYCWGANWSGQLGNGTTTTSTTPTAVVASGVLSGKTITDLSVGDAHACVVASGAAYCWGNGDRGQLGNGVAADSSVPVAVSTSGVLAGKTVTKVSAGGDQTCVVANGAAYCFGDTYNGALGNGVTSGVDQLTPVAVDATGVLAGKTVTDIAVGEYYSYNGCVIANGAAYCWGANDWGQVGTGAAGVTATPVAVSTSGVLAGKTITSLEMYEYHTCAIANGAAYCWGGNGNGYLGDGTMNGSAVYAPVAVNTSGVLAGKTMTAVSPGDYHTCGIANGAAYCWGSEYDGQLGNGTAEVSTSEPLPVTVTASGVLAGKTVTAIASGYIHTCVIANKLPYCWGGMTWWYENALGTGLSSGLALPVFVAIP